MLRRGAGGRPVTPREEEAPLSTPEKDPPFVEGSQPVPENPPEMPSEGRSVMQWVVIAIAVLVLLGVLLFFIRG